MAIYGSVSHGISREPKYIALLCYVCAKHLRIIAPNKVWDLDLERTYVQ